MRRFASIVFVAVILLFTFAGSPQAQSGQLSSESAAQATFIRALTEAYLGDHERAVELLTRVYESNPQEPTVMLALAESFDALGQDAEALYYATKAVGSHPSEPQFYTVLAELQIGAGYPESAIATYEALLQQRPNDSGTLVKLGRLQEQNGQMESALETYQRILVLDERNVALLLRMEAIHSRLGDEYGSLTRLEQAVEVFPNESSLLLRLAMKYREMGCEEDAIETLERLLTVDPDRRDAVPMLADLLEGRGELDRAEELRRTLQTSSSNTPEDRLREAAHLYERAAFDEEAAEAAMSLLRPFVQDEDAPAEALLMLGDLAYNNKEFDLAADVLRRGLAEDPRHPERWEQAAAAVLYTGDPLDALDVVEEAQILFPGRVGLLKTAAYAYAKTDRPRSALRSVSEAIEILEEESPDEIAPRVRLISFKAILQNELGEFDRSIVSFEEALDLIPDHALILNNYAYILAERDARLDDALEMALQANELVEDNAYFLDTLGWVYFKLGRYEQAAEKISEALEVDEDFALLHDHLGDVYEAMGRHADARTAWSKALELEPDNISVREKLEGN
ncbi:MAG: tetratricopeptide repeat protein [Rubricoccaceae bacterium]|nr:tetratricopeptide repeat protein [Rubricoccaceae bacterium]